MSDAREWRCPKCGAQADERFDCCEVAPQAITEVWAWICTETNGDEGIPALNAGGGMVMPMVGADAERMRSLRSAAVGIAEELGLVVKLVRFHQMEIIETLAPGRPSHGEEKECWQ